MKHLSTEKWPVSNSFPHHGSLPRPPIGLVDSVQVVIDQIRKNFLTLKSLPVLRMSMVLRTLWVILYYYILVMLVSQATNKDRSLVMGKNSTTLFSRSHQPYKRPAALLPLPHFLNLQGVARFTRLTSLLCVCHVCFFRKTTHPRLFTHTIVRLDSNKDNSSPHEAAGISHPVSHSSI